VQFLNVKPLGASHNQ